MEDHFATAARFLDLPDDWDDAGSVAVRPAAFEAAKHLIAHALIGWISWAGDEHIALPEISPSGDGGLDLLWRGGDFDLLATVEATGKRLSFYGDDGNRAVKVKGDLVIQSHGAERLTCLILMLKSRGSLNLFLTDNDFIYESTEAS